jgi:tRNA threonylcarbamoyladenosine biosynthesis protein TsaB
VILGLDTATRATVVAVLPEHGEPIELRHDPPPGERPGHARELLALVRQALEAVGADYPDVRRIGVGVGPGTFTGLRIGVATARALAQATGAEVAAVSTLEALAAAAATDRAVLAVLDARRGEAYAAAFHDGERLLGPVAIAPDGLGALADPRRAPWLAVGDGAVRFRDRLEQAAEVPADASPLHGASALAVCRLAREARPVDRDALLPEYVRQPDAVPRR